MKEKATFAAGCFWSIENAFMNLSGVIQTRVGYIGGTTKNPTYEEVCDGGTGHKEAVEVLYDSDHITYEQLLKTFWSAHNPTTRDRQGADIGKQYQSIIFYHSDTQRAAAEQSKKELQESGVYKQNIVTEIIEASDFYEAEEYHQKYLQKKGVAAACGI